jgi:hypothetical protein
VDSGDGAAAGRERGVVPLRAAPREKGSEEAVDEKFGGSTRVNGEAVLRRWRIPMRFLVGERPAGVESIELDVVMILAGDFGVRVGRVRWICGEIGANVEEEAGAFVRMKLDGLAMDVFSPLERLEKKDGSIFSASTSSS